MSQSYRSKESGGIHSFDLNGALNFYDRFYVGATLGLYSVNYDRTSEYMKTLLIRTEMVMEDIRWEMTFG